MTKTRRVIRYSVLILLIMGLTFLGSGIGGAFAENQVLDISPNNSSQGLGTNFTIAVNYNVSDGDNTLSGLGINVHFDSSKLDYLDFDNFLDKGDIASPPNLNNDTNDEDGDPNTDKMINMSWASFSAEWPDETLPTVLAQLNFTVKQSAGVGITTPINISVFEYDAGYDISLSNGSVSIPLNISDISILPTSQNFGNVDVGNSATQLFTITNIGDADLIIGNIVITGTDASEFSKQNDNCSGQTISPEGICTVEVKFFPTGSNTKTATLNIPSNDPDTPTLDVSLDGEGQQYTLTVNKDGTGTGTVTSDPIGVNCGDDCLEAYNPDAIVNLAAIPDGDSVFIGWTGGGCNGTGNCEVTMDENISVTATFTKDDVSPDADAGGNQIVNEGITVTLDGSNSTDSIGTIVSYKWTQIPGPSVTLADPNVAITNFVALPVGLDGTTLTFRLTVEDGAGLKDDDEISITVNDNGIMDFPNDAITMNCSTEEPIGIETDGGDITSLCTKDPDTIADPVGKPENLIYGLIDMQIKVDNPGDTVTVTIYLPAAAPDGHKWYKYSSQNGWYDYSDHTEFNEDRTQITITLTDGAIGDDDNDANGIIIDPSGLGTPPPAPSSDTPAPNAGDGGGGGCFINIMDLF